MDYSSYNMAHSHTVRCFRMRGLPALGDMPGWGPIGLAGQVDYLGQCGYPFAEFDSPMEALRFALDATGMPETLEVYDAVLYYDAADALLDGDMWVPRRQARSLAWCSAFVRTCGPTDTELHGMVGWGA